MNLTVAKNRYFDQINSIVCFDKLSHAYLIEIDDYENDFDYVLSFVKLILCQNKSKDSFNLSCGKCNICDQISNNSYVDLKIIEPDGNYIKKQQLLDLQEEFHNKSLLNNKRIYIIKEADKLNDSSANTILKFLEEPEENIIALLVTTNRYKVIETIISRCQILSLQDNFNDINLSDNVIDLIGFILNNDALFINYNLIFNEILPDKNTARQIFGEIESVFINYLNYLAIDNIEFSNSLIKKLLSGFSSDKIINCISIIEDELQKLNYNVNYKLWLDCLFARLIGG